MLLSFSQLHLDLLTLVAIRQYLPDQNQFKYPTREHLYYDLVNVANNYFRFCVFKLFISDLSTFYNNTQLESAKINIYNFRRSDYGI